MKVKVKLLGMPGLLQNFEGEKEVQVDFTGNTIKDLLYHLCLGIEPEKKGFFVDDQGEISPMLFVMVNGNPLDYSNRSRQPLREGDLIELAIVPG